MEEKKLTGYPSIDKPWLKFYPADIIKKPMPECSIYEYLYQSNSDNLGSNALNYFDNKITFSEMFLNIEKVANAFAALGVKQGDIVTMCTVSTPETIYAIYALNKLGAISNMVDPRTSVEGIHNYIKEVNSKIVLCLDVACDKIITASQNTNVTAIVVSSPSDSLPQPKKLLYKVFKSKKKPNNHCLIYWKKFILMGTNHVGTIPYQKNRCCVIVHTGGTTGQPKGVMLSNENINAMTYQSILTGIELKRNQTWLNIMPPFIAYGIGTGLHVPLVVGMETILIPSFEPQKFADYLNKYHPNHMVGVPSHYENIINDSRMKDKDLSYIIAPIVGGDTMQRDLEISTNTFLHAHSCTYKISKGYGMTEVSAAVSVCLRNDCNKLGSVGVPFSHTTIAAFDVETGQELPYGESGEICINGPNTMLGYYGNSNATNAILKTHNDGKVWVHSGDIGFVDEDGFLFIIDRMKRMIIRHDGFKIFPSQIESVIIDHEAIADCCAVSIKDPEHLQGNLPIAYVVPKNITTVSDCERIGKELAALCEASLPEYAQPVAFRFIDKLPLTPIGKVDYRALEKQAQEQETSQ